MTYTDDEIRQHRQLTLNELRRAGPEHFDMNQWFGVLRDEITLQRVEVDDRDDFGDYSSQGFYRYSLLEAVADGLEPTACGTVCCFAGAAAAAWASVDHAGCMTALGSDAVLEEYVVAHWLGFHRDPVAGTILMFHATQWPEPLLAEVERLELAGMSERRAQWNVLVQWLAHIINPDTKPPWEEP